MEFIPTQVPAVIQIHPELHEDERGSFSELYHAKKFARAGIPLPFVQHNHSRSRRGVLRGLHYQIRHPQGKLVRALTGEVFDVAVDLRRPSPTFGKWTSVTLSAENRMMVWIPGGFAHGFFVMSEWAEVEYLVTDFFSPKWDRTLLWDDPAIGISWPLGDTRTPILSAKDAAGKRLEDCETYPWMAPPIEAP